MVTAEKHWPVNVVLFKFVWILFMYYTSFIRMEITMTCLHPQKCVHMFGLLIIYSFIVFPSVLSENGNYIPLVPGEFVQGHKGLEVYCYQSSIKSLLYLWKSVYLDLKIPPSEYTLFDGENETCVFQQYDEHISAWFPVLPWQESTISFPAFKQYCIGIYASEMYTLQLTVRRINFWKVLHTALGISLFLCAATLSRNSFFHYTSGVSFGVFASFLILVFILSKLIPKKPAAYTFLIFGVSTVFYGFQILYYNLKEVFLNHSNAVITYIAVSAFISFIVCYRFGPVCNVKTLNLIQWFLQLIGILLIFFSSEYREASTAIIIVVLSAYSIPTSCILKFRCLWCYYFPPKVKLLTEMEYIEQGNTETKIALENLRTYCRSPECKTWFTVKKLKDPVRFAQFVEGESHLNDDEILDYDALSVYPDTSQEFTDDDSDSESCVRQSNNRFNCSRR